MTIRTETFDDDHWQLVPRRATDAMLTDLKLRAGDIVKMERQGERLNFCCNFGLVYRLLLAAAPTPMKGRAMGHDGINWNVQ